MKKLAVALFCGMMIFFGSCEKEDIGGEKVPEKAAPREEIFTMSTNDNKGFSAEYLRLADSPKVKPDFIIIPQTNLTGDVMSPFLSHPNFERRFILSKEFEDAASAQAYFDSYNVDGNGQDLQQFALNLRANQVWLIKTREGDYCKILILETRIEKKSDFAEVKFKAERI
jgi:hypothetical protein